jgi:hypothetical protein
MSSVVYIVADPSLEPHPEWGVPVGLYRLAPNEREYAGRLYNSTYADSGWTQSGERSYRVPGRNTDGWLYIVVWEDGWRGLVRLRDINAALAATGAMFDPEPPI